MMPLRFTSLLVLLFAFAASTFGTATAAVVYAQIGLESSTGNGATASDTDDNQQMADDFTLAAAATIRSVKWWGQYGPFDQTPVPPLTFQIIFYGDSGGLPDTSNVLSSTTVQFAALDPPVEIIPDPFRDNIHYEFRADITPTPIPAGTKVWFSVLANTANDPDDSFLIRKDDQGTSAWRNNLAAPFNAEPSRLLFELHNTPLRPGTTLYADDFSGAGDLHGTAPDTRPGAETWVASANLKADGTTTSVNSQSSDDSAFLPFTPLAGKIYTLSANLTQPTGGYSIDNTNAWAAIGFSAGTGTGAFAANPNNPSPWMQMRRTGQVRTLTGPATTGSVNEPNTYDKRRILNVVLDTTAANWTAEWFVGVRSVRKITFTTNPVINYIGLAREDGVAVNFDSFRLTAVDAAEIPPRIVSFSRVGGNLWELDLLGNPGMPFELRSSTDLTFAPGNLLENLTQGAPGDPGTIGGPANSVITTDPNGNARMRFPLGGHPADFVRAVALP